MMQGLLFLRLGTKKKGHFLISSNKQHLFYLLTTKKLKYYVEIKCQLDAT